MASTLGLGAVRTDDCALNAAFGSRFPLEDSEGTLTDLQRDENIVEVSKIAHFELGLVSARTLHSEAI